MAIRLVSCLLLSSFISKKLDTFIPEADTWRMRDSSPSPTGPGPIMAFVRRRIARGGERLWQLEDFRDLSFTAVAQALSRLKREGTLERLSKGVYYRTRDTAFGKSRPNPATIHKLAAKRKAVFPAGIAAANLLGFTTQTARRREIATSALSCHGNLSAARRSSIRVARRCGQGSQRKTQPCSTS